jgi:glycosyltransferase involved in cell wall biosynthesis
MERAVAAVAAGLARIGHRSVIVTCVDPPPAPRPGTVVTRLRSLAVTFPSVTPGTWASGGAEENDRAAFGPLGDTALRTAATTGADAVADELADIYARHRVDVAVYVDALWGLGRIMPTGTPARRVLAAHVVGHDVDLRAALDRAPTAVVAPSPTVLATATARGYDTTAWVVVPNAMLFDPPPLDLARRTRLRRDGTVRVLARLGPEKGVDALLAATPAGWARPVEVALAGAAFEADDGEQHRLLQRCRDHADRLPAVSLGPGQGWSAVPAWLAGAAMVIVPSLRETFGLVAAEAMAGGTPVVAYALDNLPHLVGDGGVLVPPGSGPAGLWQATRDLLDDPLRYEATCRAAHRRAQDFRPAVVAGQLLKAVS